MIYERTHAEAQIMTTFIDGPAAGRKLMLHRAVHFLRVVRNHKGEFDALDQLGDKPDALETIFAYVMHEYQGNCHIRAAKGAGGFFPIVSYKLVEPQPSDAEMRTTKAWHAWALAHAPEGVKP